MWEVICRDGGVPVREDLSPLAAQSSSQLQRGSLLTQLELVGQNLHYELASGEGPERGWIAVALNDTVLACRVYPADDLAEEEPSLPCLHSNAAGVTDETEARQRLVKQAAAEAHSHGDFHLALKLVTEAIALGQASALMYSRRANILLKLERPRAAIRDCNSALRVDESATALKTRGRAYASLEMWSEAAADLQDGLRLDMDEIARAELAEILEKFVPETTKVPHVAAVSWEVTGGADTGGVIVREGVELHSAKLPQRLSCGAVVEEVEFTGKRLLFRRISGTGPDRGWISVAVNGKVLACRVSPTTAGQLVDDSDTLAPEEPLPMAPEHVKELSNEMRQRQDDLKQRAAEAVESGNMVEAVDLLTEAVCCGCSSALLYCRRAQVLLSLGRPRSALIDSTAALQINPDCGRAYSIRARAHAKLRHWSDAHADFQESLKIDYDESTYAESLAVAARVKQMHVVVTSQRLEVEEEQRRRKAAAAKAEQEAAALIQLKAQATLERGRAEARRNAEKLTRHPQLAGIFSLAKRKGWMCDFVGMKRGRCKCNTCEVYCWMPRKLSSCASANVPVQCLVCGCLPSKHVDLGYATQEDL